MAWLLPYNHSGDHSNVTFQWGLPWIHRFSCLLIHTHFHFLFLSPREGRYRCCNFRTLPGMQQELNNICWINDCPRVFSHLGLATSRNVNGRRRQHAQIWAWWHECCGGGVPREQETGPFTRYCKASMKSETDTWSSWIFSSLSTPWPGAEDKKMFRNHNTNCKEYWFTG